LAEAFAGLICGYALSVIATPLFALALVRGRVSSSFIQRAMPQGTNVAALSIVLHVFLLLVLTAVGMLLGMLLYGLESNRPDGGLGSPNRVFTAVILAIAAIAVLPLASVLPRQRVALLVAGIVFAITFGWLMPYLSLLGPEE
jgi:hypothetical protein